MSTGLHATAREDLGLPHVSASTANMSSTSSLLSIGVSSSDATSHGLPKPLSLSPRTFGMDDFRDFCGPLGSFKTGLTPRVFSTGLTPRSGFTPRFTTGFTPRPTVSTGMLGGSAASSSSSATTTDTNGFFSRNTGFSPRALDINSKISPTGYTPKDISGMKMPMRFPGTFSTSPPKPGSAPPPEPAALPMHKHHPAHLAPHPGDMGPSGGLNMGMFDYLNRPGVPTPPQTSTSSRSSNVSPMSEKATSSMTQEELDERRRMKNRERVRKCRKRKQDRLNYLEDRTTELEKENALLKTKVARKASGKGAEPLSEAALKELRKKQNTTLSAYIRAYSETDGAFEAGARSVWSDNAEVSYGNMGVRIAGVEHIIANKKDASHVFRSMKIKQYNVQWRPEAHDKCTVHWEVEVSLKANAPSNVPLTAPFAELSAHFSESDILTFTMVSHLTFDEGKIVEEMRQPVLLAIADRVMNKYASEPQKASAALRALMHV